MNCISLDLEIACFDKNAYIPLQIEHKEFINMLRHSVDGAYGRYVILSITKAKCFQMLGLYRWWNMKSRHIWKKIFSKFGKQGE